MATAYRFGGFELQPDRRRLLADGRPQTLGQRAFDVLQVLIERRERIVGKNELLDVVWPGLVVEENNLQVQISALRKLLGPQAIATIPGRGYRFTVALDDATAERAAEGHCVIIGRCPVVDGHHVVQPEAAIQLAALHDVVQMARATQAVVAGDVLLAVLRRADQWPRNH